MGSWELFWAVLLVATMAVFFCLAVVVTIGGFRDTRAMFRNIRTRHEGE